MDDRELERLNPLSETEDLQEVMVICGSLAASLTYSRDDNVSQIWQSIINGIEVHRSVSRNELQTLGAMIGSSNQASMHELETLLDKLDILSVRRDKSDLSKSIKQLLEHHNEPDQTSFLQNIEIKIETDQPITTNELSSLKSFCKPGYKNLLDIIENSLRKLSLLHHNEEDIIAFLQNGQCNMDSSIWRIQNLRQLEINDNDLRITNIDLGQGGFGKVSIGYYRGAEVAIKMIKKRSTSFYEIENEILLMKSLGSHPLLTTCYGYSNSSYGMNIVLELAPYGSLKDIVYNKDSIPNIPDVLILAWLSDMSNTLDFIHSKKVKHRDIKADNFLVFNNCNIKLCDFGLAKQHASHAHDNSVSDVAGTWVFMAPEVLMGEGSQYASDMYSFGITSLQIMARRPPFTTWCSMKDHFEHVVDRLNVEKKDILEKVLVLCCDKSPSGRPTAKAVYDELSDILRSNGGDPRATDHRLYGLISSLVPRVATKNAVSTLTASEAMHLLVYLGCSNEIYNRIEIINGRYLLGITSVEILQALEDNNSLIRVPILNNVFQELRALIHLGIPEDIMEKLSDLEREYNQSPEVIENENKRKKQKRTFRADNTSIREAIKYWCEKKEEAILLYGEISDWDTSEVTNMSNLFMDRTEFNDNISKWNVCNVVNMSYMFWDARAFNQPIKKWSVDNVQYMNGMFYGASSFNQSLKRWNVVNVINMEGMFFNAEKFNQSLNGWNVSNVTKMSYMFNGAACFNRPLDNWDVSKVVNMYSLFRNAAEFNQPLNTWNTSSVVDMEKMFAEASIFNQPLNNWDVSNVRNMKMMFYFAAEFNQNLNEWNVSNVQDMTGMFLSADSFNQPLDNWNISQVTSFQYMFQYARSFNQSLTTWNLSGVESMHGMFHMAESFNQRLDG